MNKMNQLYEGKAKRVYETEDPNLLIVSYKDDATAFNGLKKGTIAGKGAINNQMSNRLMMRLAEAGVPKAVLLSILGTDSDIADKYYTHVGEDAQQLAITAISDIRNGKSAQEKVSAALALLKNNAEITQDVREQLLRILGN